jgi:hypothetical protein
MACAGCDKSNPDAFYPSIKKWCRECWRDRVRANRAANIEHYLEFDRLRANNPERIAARRDYLARTKHDPKRKARLAVSNAIRTGKLRVQPCERCGYGVGVHAHHEDYSKPLDVNWLCKPCHGQRHREINAERRKTA